MWVGLRGEGRRKTGVESWVVGRPRSFFPGKSINLKCRQETGDGVEWVAVESKPGRSVVGIGT